MAASERRPDDQFPMLMGKDCLCRYLGPSSAVVDDYIELGLDKAIIKRNKEDERPLFSRPLVDKWLNTIGY
jgi:hypothetical protein